MPPSEVDLALELAVGRLKAGQAIRYTARGRSMWPTILDGDQVTIGPVCHAVDIGHIVWVYHQNSVRLHRVVSLGPDGRVCTRGDALGTIDGWFAGHMIAGRLLSVRRKGRLIHISQSPFSVLIAHVLGHCRLRFQRFRSR